MDPSFQFEDMISALLNSCGGSSEDGLLSSTFEDVASLDDGPQLDTKENNPQLLNNGDNHNNKGLTEPSTFGDIVSNGALTPDLSTSKHAHEDIRPLTTKNNNYNNNDNHDDYDDTTATNATPTCEEAVRTQSYLVRNNANDADDVQEVDDASSTVDISQFQPKDDQTHSSANPMTKSKMIVNGEENDVKKASNTTTMTTTTMTTLGDTSDTNIPAKILASKEPQSICDKWGLEDDSKCATPTSLDFNRASLSHSPLSSESPVSSQVSQFSGSSSLGYGSNSGSDPINFIDVLNHRDDHSGYFGPFISQDSGLGGGSSPHLTENHDGLNHQTSNIFWDVNGKSNSDETGLFPMNDLSTQRKGVSLMGLEANEGSSSELGLQGLTGLFLNDEDSLSQTEITGFSPSSNGQPPQMSHALKNILQLSILESQTTPMSDLNAHQGLPESPTGMLDQDLYRPPLSNTPNLALTTHLSNALLGLEPNHQHHHHHHHRQPPQIHPPHLSTRDLKQSANATTLFNDGCATFPNSTTSTLMAGRSSRNGGSSYPNSLPSPPLDIYGGGISPNETLMENLAALAQLSEMEDPNAACFPSSGDFMVPPPDMMGYNLPQYPKTVAFPGSNRLNTNPNRAYMEHQLMNQRSSLSPPLHTGRYPLNRSTNDWNHLHHHQQQQQPNHHHQQQHSSLNGLDSSRSGGRGCQPNRTSKPMTVLVKFGQLGQGRGMFNSPHGFCLGLNQEIIIADTYNNRIQVCDKHGNSLYCFGVPGKDEGQLWCPRKIAVFPDTGNFVICDRGGQRSRMQIFTSHGQFVRQIPIRYIDIVAGLAINRHNQIVAVDSVTPTVFILSQYGELIRYIDCSADMEEPSDIAIHGREYYICDFKGHSVVVLHEDGTLLRRVGNKSVTQFPNGIDISDEGDILIGDSHGNQFHVAVYSNAGQLISEFQCPTVKVSRCCGLKITYDGAVVTLAKNNHHVLVLDTLCIY